MSVTERNARLDDLQQAVTAWYDREQKRLAAEVKFLKVVRDANGTGVVAAKNTDAAAQLVTATISDFMSG